MSGPTAGGPVSGGGTDTLADPLRSAATVLVGGRQWVGVGVDLVDVAAFAAQLAETGTAFDRVFTPGERRAAHRRAEVTGAPAQHLAARWAAKEAFLKAWSSTRYGGADAMAADEVDLREIEVRTDAAGRPALCLHGRVAELLGPVRTQLSLSHDPAAGSAGLALAFVLLIGGSDE